MLDIAKCYRSDCVTLVVKVVHGLFHRRSGLSYTAFAITFLHPNLPPPHLLAIASQPSMVI